MGGCFSLWLSRSSAVPHEAMIPNCLNRTSGRISLLQNTLHPVYAAYSFSVVNVPVNECVCLCVSPNLQLAVIRPVLNSNPLTTSMIAQTPS